MSPLTRCCQTFIYKLSSKTFRVSVIFVLTIATAIAELICGVRAQSNSLIADGLYSFAEGLCLIGVIMVLHYSHDIGNRHRRNTFGYERLELLFGLMQEVFLLSISLGVIVDAVNHLIHPMHVHDPLLMIYLGLSGLVVGFLGIVMFWGYHHDHNVKEEIAERRKKDFVNWTKKNVKARRATTKKSKQQQKPVESPLMNEQRHNESAKNSTDIEINPIVLSENQSILKDFTYENVSLQPPQIYATLHALCLHSFVVFLESAIVIVSGALIYVIPHNDPKTGKEINQWLKYVDPLLTLVMVFVIIIHAVPVIFSISRVLIETVPEGIETQNVMSEINSVIPAIKNIHSMHIWRATATEIYATLHIILDEDVNLSKCTHEYTKEIQKIFQTYCIRQFTVQYEYVPPSTSDNESMYRCVHILHRNRRGHSYRKSHGQATKDESIQIE